MRPSTLAAAIAAGLLALTACSEPPAPRSASTTPPPTTASASPTPSPTPSTPFAMGAKYTWHGEYEGKTLDGHTTVLSYTQPVQGISGPGEGLGYAHPVWAVVDIKVCNTKGETITVSRMPWSLSFPDDTRADASTLSGGDMPKPEFPTLDTVLKPGDCLRGKVPFIVEKGKRPDRIIYTAGEAEPVEWTVPAK
ncbi:DUF4352 domain-containing protein [Micromonospora parva]|uniref:DUF4352 domain-containing protein n=1 Tax=Micromonospora parva TaxID=1464048 RepID=UPI00366682AC